MASVRQRDVVRFSNGTVSARVAHAWAQNGLPHFEHDGEKKRWRYIVRAAAIQGITITGDEILRLSAEHKQKLAEGKL
jgi:hypothetical protein